MTYDVTTIRKRFPALAEGAAHFDGPQGSQVPSAVADAVAATMTSAISNRGLDRDANVGPWMHAAGEVGADVDRLMAAVAGLKPR